MNPRKRSHEDENTSPSPLSKQPRAHVIDRTHHDLPFSPITLNQSPAALLPQISHAPTSTPNISPWDTTPQTNFTFVDGFAPVPNIKRKRLNTTATSIAVKTGQLPNVLSTEDHNRLQEADETRRLNQALDAIDSSGFPTLYSFLDGLLNTKDRARSAQVSRMLKRHGSELLDSIHHRQPAIANDWAISTMRQLIEAESRRLAKHFQPQQKTPVAQIINHFSLEGIVRDLSTMAPSIYGLLHQISFPEVANVPVAKKEMKNELIIATTLCMLAKSRNDHATEFQTVMCMYFLACGTSRSQFDVLNHAGISLSYSQAIKKLKQLGEERLGHIRSLACTKAFMLIWDNLNIAFKVGEQRHASKDHFDSGCTASLILLFGVEPGQLPLKPKRETRHLILDFGPEDLLPSREEAQRVEDAQLWHIEDILYTSFPLLRKCFDHSIPPAPSVMQIPVHKTEQYPLPAMHVDESSLEGTLEVLNTTLCKTLHLSEDEIRQHGLVICAGDQLNVSLLDKISAIRRDDADFIDNVGLYTEGQDGLLHVKFSHTRMVANEHWGAPNSKSPWSLWKVNTLLGRKPIVVGWNAKSLPPFRPVYKLMLDLALPTNILDAFRIYCPKEKLEDWVSAIQTVDEVRQVTEQVLRNLCSGRRVSELRQLPRAAKRDVPLENIILFNRDCLHLRQLKYAIKRGDVGAILDLITHLMLAFRGTGKTPKYADALFSIVMRLKNMDAEVRKAWLMNWLANLSGRANSFKEMDLLQEHQNFWAKIIYNAKGPNRSWEWLTMVSVSIFALRDVIRKVQDEFQTPFNNPAHTTPATEIDIRLLRDYLEAQHIQLYSPQRANNDCALVAHDLISVGSQYANTSGAFKSFSDMKYAVDFDDISSSDPDPTTGMDTIDLDLAGDPELDDLALDDDEYPVGTDIGDYVATIREAIDELSQYE